MRRPLLAAPLIAALLAACSTELQVNEPYRDTTIVYGLLNQRDSVHLVKINKAFLGEGNAYDMALVRDSSEYRDEDITYAMVFRIDASGALADSFPLRDTVIADREPGTFYAPVQKLYYFRTPFAQSLPPGSLGVPMYLWENDSYRLELHVKGKAVRATTPIANNFPIDPVDLDTVANGARVGLRNLAGTEYASYEFNWKAKEDNKRFVVSWRLRYDEVAGADTAARSITQLIGTKVATYVNEDMAILLSGETFFSTVAARIKAQPGWQAVDKRIFRGLDFLVSVANGDFHTYLTLTEPVTGIVNDRPAYSNLENAIGIWGSRYTKNAVGKRLSFKSFDELIGGHYTGDLRFCSPLDGYACP